MDNNELLQFFKNDKNILCASKLKWQYIKKHQEIYDYMINYFVDIENDTSPIELLYRIVNGVYEIPKCPICGHTVVFNRWDRGYNEFCSIQCRRSKIGEHIVREKTEQTFISKYGYKNASQNQEIKNKMIQTNQKKYNGNCMKSINFINIYKFYKFL